MSRGTIARGAIERLAPDAPAADLRRVLGENGARHGAGHGVLAVPTESSYGLAVDPRDADGVEAIYRIKHRERGKPLPVIASNIAQIVALGVAVDAPELTATAPLWPSPLSAVLPTSVDLPASAGTGTIAVRIPAHPALRTLLDRLGHALTATSANLAGEPPVLDPADLDAILNGHRAAIVDGGVLPGGPPSTLVAWDADGTPRVLRQGAFPAERLPRLARKMTTAQRENPC